MNNAFLVLINPYLVFINDFLVFINDFSSMYNLPQLQILINDL